MPILLSLLLSLPCLQEGERGGIPVPSNREVLSLNGLWQLRVLDPGQMEAGESSRPWRDIFVPSSFETVLGAGFDGNVEYRKVFRVPEPGLDDEFFLRFGAVMTRAKVLLNGRELGGHLGGWTPFRVRATGAVGEGGRMDLRVLVEERPGHPLQGFLPAIQPHFGGIWQDVEWIHLSGPALDPDEIQAFPGWEEGRADLRLEFGASELPLGARIRCRILDPPRTRFEAVERIRLDQERVLPMRWSLPPEGGWQPWSPADPKRYRLELSLLDPSGRVRDRLERGLLFRRIEVRGRTILLNGAPLQVRGVLHWGYEPPTLDPRAPEGFWAAELRHLGSLGFNLIKACLWLPPPSFFEAAEKTGFLVWQEYPAWHPDFSEERLALLQREYEEFFRLDRSRMCILARSLTCETGRAGASARVVERLYQRCKEVTGAPLVEDDSSWISWNRFHDFYDDHPYGNCGPWLGRLRGFDRYIQEHGPRPFLLGEAMASDTWLRIGLLKTLLQGEEPWWKPFALAAQKAFETRIGVECGPEAAEALVPDSLAYALQARKYQSETFRRVLPRAGYVSSVYRDFRQARMGFVDDAGEPKWGAEEFAWHGDRMLVLDDPRAIRSLSLERFPGFLLPVLRLAGNPPRDPLARLSLDARVETWRGGGSFRTSHRMETGWKVRLEPEVELLSRPFGEDRTFEGPVPSLDGVQRLVLRPELEGIARNRWTFYILPEVGPLSPPPGLRMASELSPRLLEWVEQGGRLLLTAGGSRGLRSQRLWFLRGAPYAPMKHPLFAGVPRELLFHLQQLDFDGPVFRKTPLTRCFDTLLGFWDSHDQKERVEDYAFLLEARAGEGRILACALNLDLRPELPFASRGEEKAPNPARAFLRAKLLQHLAKGPPPRALLPPGLLARCRTLLQALRIPLDGTWLLRADPGDRGVKEGWFREDHPEEEWLEARAGVHWEHVGLPHYDGVAWYRKRFRTPGDWTPGSPLFLVFEGVDDSYILFVNGKRAASFGDPKTGETVWLVRTQAEVSRLVRPGENLCALRVVDHGGAGGLHRKVFLSTARAEEIFNP